MAYTPPAHDSIDFIVQSGYVPPVFDDIDFGMTPPLGTVVTPVISPINGKYLTTQNISIETVTAGATIYYTIDGTDPDSNSILYSAPFSMGADKTIKAIATKLGYDDSGITSRTYQAYKVGPVTIYPDNSKRIYYSSHITLSSYTPDVTIYYTTDGSDPNETSNLYTEPFHIFRDTTVKAVAIREGYVDSDIEEKAYIIKPRWENLNHGKRWKDVLDVGIWDFEKSHADNRYNEGSLIATSLDPTWGIDDFSKIPITDRHDPCGYWLKDYIQVGDIIPSGQLYGSGKNEAAQLGTGFDLPQEYDIFVKSDITKNFVKVVMGRQGHYTMALADDGTLWVCGTNGNGCLGSDPNIRNPYLTLTQVPGTWKDIAASHYYNFSAGIKTDGTLWTTGLNNYGQLGLGDEVDRWAFTQVGIKNDWVKVMLGSFYMMVLNSSGHLFATGDAYQGATGLGYISGKENELVQVLVSDVVGISCGYYTTIIEHSNGYLSVTGSNNDGQLALGDLTARGEFEYIPGISNVKSFCMGHSNNTAYGGVLFIIKADGTLWAAGNNNNNIMGIPDTSDRLTLVDTGMTNCKRVHSKEYSVLVSKIDGSLWGCGLNAEGELGLGDTIARTEFELISSEEHIDFYCQNSSMIIK